MSVTQIKTRTDVPSLSSWERSTPRGSSSSEQVTSRTAPDVNGHLVASLLPFWVQTVWRKQHNDYKVPVSPPSVCPGLVGFISTVTALITEVAVWHVRLARLLCDQSVFLPLTDSDTTCRDLKPFNIRYYKITVWNPQHLFHKCLCVFTFCLLGLIFVLFSSRISSPECIKPANRRTPKTRKYSAIIKQQHYHQTSV